MNSKKNLIFRSCNCSRNCEINTGFKISKLKKIHFILTYYNSFSTEKKSRNYLT